VNGSLGTLHSIRPRYPEKIRAIIEQAIIDQDVLLVRLGDRDAIARVSERDRKNAEDDVLVLSNDLDAIARVEKRKKNLETHITRRPGDVITIDAPLAIFFNLPGAAPTLKQPLVFPTKSSSIKRRLLVKIFGIDQNRKKIQVNITDSGYICAFTGTGYSVQGQTLEKNILEVNRNRDNPPILSFYNVGASRVENNLHLRILPFKIGPGAKDHLLNLRYEDEYLIWMNSFDENGNFSEQLMAQAKLNLPPPLDTHAGTSARASRPTRQQQPNTSNTNTGAMGVNAVVNGSGGRGVGTTIGGRGNDGSVGGRSGRGREGRGVGSTVGGRTGGGTVGGRSGEQGRGSFGGRGNVGTVSGRGLTGLNGSGNSLTSGLTTHSSFILPPQNHVEIPIYMHNGAIYHVQPNALTEFNLLQYVRTVASESWAMVPFLNAVFETNIDINQPTRYVTAKFWGNISSWENDVQVFRNNFRLLPGHLYERIKTTLGQHTHAQYISADNQEILLVMNVHGGIIQNQEMREYYLLTTIPQEDQQIQNAIDIIIAIKTRLVNTITRMKIAYSIYTTQILIDGVNPEEITPLQLATVIPNGIENVLLLNEVL
jgi:hypothetical protein